MTMQQRPTLTPEEIAALRGHDATLSTAQSVLDDLAEIGVDVGAHQDLLNTTAQVSKGLLERFTATQYVPPRNTRGRR